MDTETAAQTLTETFGHDEAYNLSTDSTGQLLSPKQIILMAKGADNERFDRVCKETLDEINTTLDEINTPDTALTTSQMVNQLVAMQVTKFKKEYAHCLPIKK